MYNLIKKCVPEDTSVILIENFFNFEWDQGLQFTKSNRLKNWLQLPVKLLLEDIFFSKKQFNSRFSCCFSNEVEKIIYYWWTWKNFCLNFFGCC